MSNDRSRQADVPRIEITPELVRRVADFFQKEVADPEGHYDSSRRRAEREAEALLRFVFRPSE